MRSLLTTLVLSCVVTSVRSAFVDLFSSPSRSDYGGCDGQTDLIDTWLVESLTLADAGLEAVADYDSDLVVRLMFDAFFGQKQTGDREIFDVVSANLNQVASFLQKGLSGNKPWLFCDSSWLVWSEWQDVAKDARGNDLLIDGALVSLQEVDDERYSKAFKATDPVQVPYFAPDVNNYLFASDVKGTSFCASGASLAGTQTEAGFKSVTLCLNNILRTPEIATLDTNTVGRSGLSLTKFFPKSATLFHELFHLVSGQLETEDVPGYRYADVAAYATSPDDIPYPEEKDPKTAGYYNSYNPEIYVFFCVAYHQYVASGRKWKFTTSRSSAV
ncbi:hypothetical protein M436DRAFT_60164 [Aureobasidium namibiae CBS 147.97]|uniref:Lysine-specific metallo-endopeptidase domain-containing protein n=1 Tax=Aureobasidium namibiae CBS 147.97 TaxID=1043004 RepID=A0A074XUD9_9PEZI